jgi:hypothetical protein
MPRISAVIALLLLTSTLAAARGVKEGKLYDVPKLAATSPLTIVPGASVGPIKFNMTKEDVFKALGNPDTIYFGDTRYSLRDKPMAAYYVFRSAGLSILFQWEQMRSISVLSEQYELPGGVRVGMDVSKAEAVLGKGTGISATSQNNPEAAIWYWVYQQGDVPLLKVGYQGGSLLFKVDRVAKHILEMRLYAAHRQYPIDLLIDPEDPITSGDAKSARATDSALLANLGITLDKYALALEKTALFETASGKPIGGLNETHLYFLKHLDRAEFDVQAASFSKNIDSYGRQGPSVAEIVKTIGVPGVITVKREAGATTGSGELYYGRNLVNLFINSKWVSASSFQVMDTLYRYNGLIGVGSTMDEVFAALGKPVRTEQISSSFSNSTGLVLSVDKDHPEYSSIAYWKQGCFFNFKNGIVLNFTRFWLFEE